MAIPSRMNLRFALLGIGFSVDGLNVFQFSFFPESKKAGWPHDQHSNKYEKIDRLFTLLADPVT
jgi:hypothetical protein